LLIHINLQESYFARLFLGFADLRPAAKAVGEKTLFIDEMLTRRCYRDFELNELASTDNPATKGKTISDN
jgi:hypothetical protein